MTVLLAVFSDLKNEKQRTRTIRRAEMKSLRKSLAAILSIAFMISAGFASTGCASPGNPRVDPQRR